MNSSGSYKKNVQLCDIALEEFSIEPFILVIFGGAGDLSRRKLFPTLFNIYRRGKLPAEFLIIGFGRQNLNAVSFRNLLKESLLTFSPPPHDEKQLDQFLARVSFLHGTFEDEGAYAALAQQIEQLNESYKKVLYYMSVPSNMFPVIINRLGEKQLNKDKERSKIIIEKPFGHDLSSSRKLSQALAAVFDEDQIFRMDHYLGKETVQNIIFFRFSNSIFEPLWNRRYIDNVQITVAENIGIEHRGHFYEQTGVIRDIVQNHIMQLISLVAMEPLISFKPELVRDEKVKVYQAIRRIPYDAVKDYSIVGQYSANTVNRAVVNGYRDERDVDKDSNVATYFAGKFLIDNWRWAGVPFYVRTGKRLPKKLTEIVIEFKQPPLKLFQKSCLPLKSSHLKLRIQPEEEIILHFGVKYPETAQMIHPVNMEFSYPDYFNTTNLSPYERLIVDSLKGDQTLFVRQDGIEEMWNIVDPIIKYWENRKDFQMPLYKAFTWGPSHHKDFIAGDNREWIST